MSNEFLDFMENVRKQMSDCRIPPPNYLLPLSMKPLVNESLLSSVTFIDELGKIEPNPEFTKVTIDALNHGAGFMQNGKNIPYEKVFKSLMKHEGFTDHAKTMLRG